MTETLHQRIADVLSKLRNPRTGHDIVRDQMIRDVATTTSGKVRRSACRDAFNAGTLAYAKARPRPSAAAIAETDNTTLFQQG